MATRRNPRGNDNRPDMDETRIYRRNDPYSRSGGQNQGDYGYDGEYPDGSYYYHDAYDPYGNPTEDSYGNDGYYDDGFYGDSGSYDYSEYDDGYDDGYYGEDSGYDDGYYDDDYGYSQRQGPSMAARAAGQASSDPYRRQRRANRPAGNSGRRQPAPAKKPKKKKRHPFRNFMLFLLIFVCLLAGAYFFLFDAPEQTERVYHSRKEDFYNILICATDEEELRTDTIMLFTLDEPNKAITLTSLPRDTLLEDGSKLNSVYGYYGGGETGAEALLTAAETILGFRPDGYVVVNYQIFKDLVDAMGGVTFDVPMDMEVDNANNPNDILYISAGEQVLDGTQALGVCRYRYGYSMADIQRQYVQQSFLKTMIRQCVSPTKILRMPKMYSAVMGNIQTNLSDANLRYLALHGILCATGNIQQQTLPGEGVNYYGASCYGLFGESVKDMVNESINPFYEDLTMDEITVYTVYDGYLVRSTWAGTAFDASQYVYE